MKIVLAIGSLEIGGTERQVVRLASELERRGHDVTVLVLSGRGPLADTLDENGVEIWTLRFETLVARTADGRIRPFATLGLWTAWWQLVCGLRARRPDVVHAFLFWSYVLVLPAALLARVPLRISGRRNLGTEKHQRPVYPLLERLADRCSDVAVANAHAVADVVHAAGVPRARLRVIYNGTDLPPPAADVAAEPPRAAMIANLIAYKGHADLFAALARLDRPPHVDLYGDGPERDRLVRLAEELNVTGHVTFHGRVPDAARQYAQVQFAILTSHEEGLPNAILEAMAVGLPVIATDVGGVGELVHQGATGLLVPAMEPAALAQAIEALANDPQRRVELGAAGRRAVEERFSWQRCVDEHEALYRGP